MYKPEHTPAVQTIQLEQMLKSGKFYLPISMSLAAILAAVQYRVIDHAILFGWLLALFAIMTLRTLVYRHFLKTPMGDIPLQTGDRLRKFRLGVLLGGLAWGVSGYLLFPVNSPQHQIFLIFMLAGMTVGGVIAYSADFISAAMYALTLVIPLGCGLLLSGGDLSIFMSIALMLYLVFIIMFLKQLNRNISENILMRINASANEEEIKLSEERYRLLLYHSPVGIFHFNRNLVITYCNEIIVSTLQSSTDLIVGLDMNKLQDQSLVLPAKEALAGKIGHYEGQYNATFTDVSLWIAMICAPSRDSKGDIVGGIGIVQDITERKEAADEIRKLAFYDPLTSLPNRRLLMDWLKQAVSTSNRCGKPGALLFIDLDNFKHINDTYGHDTGDLLLQQVAARIVSCVRENDTVSRLSGDEFVVILELLSENRVEAATQTEAIGEKIRLSLNQPYRISAHVLHTTTSIGATLFNSSGQNTEEIMKQADIAMYEAKNCGRNAIRFFDPVMQEAVNNRISLVIELNKALENREFHLYYQIQMDCEHRYLGAEILLRWIHPRLGMISPAKFIPLAEETGLITSIGRWVLEAACDQIKSWQANKHTCDLALSVNISARQFRQPDFVNQVRSALHRHVINPRLLKLELTESVVLDNIERIIQIMNELKEIGIQFSLDDFGTGYSSLQYLKRLPLDQLKIDQSFVRDLVRDTNDQAIVSTIIAMAHSLNLDVIAEGVETEEQKHMLLEKNCRHYQGYLFGKPVPIEDFEMQLENRKKPEQQEAR